MATKKKSAKVKAAHPEIGELGETRAPAERWQRGSEPELVTIDDEPTSGRDLRPRVQRVLTGLRQLERTGRIDGADIASAVRWRQDYELAVHAAKDPEARGSSGGGGVGAWLAAIVDVVTRHREASEAVGNRGDELLRLYVAEGVSLRQISDIEVGSRSNWNHRSQVSDELQRAIKGLTAHYEAVQKRGRRIMDRTGGPARYTTSNPTRVSATL